jgi:hypothetical protein
MNILTIDEPAPCEPHGLASRVNPSGKMAGPTALTNCVWLLARLVCVSDHVAVIHGATCLLKAS